MYMDVQVFGGDDSDDEELPSTGMSTGQVGHGLFRCTCVHVAMQ